MAEVQSNPLVEALPPATDYITYLTILEYNLTKEQLPLLEELLQDIALTTNIGWDLVHLLTPLLPESEACLHAVARLGNPREVILKVTELLEVISTSGYSMESDDEDGSVDATVPDYGSSAIMAGQLLEFTTLLDMISILHPRIKTKNPSRFLINSFEAILPAYARVATQPAAVAAILKLLESLSQASRPQLPPRRSETAIPQQKLGQSASDPEACAGPMMPEEKGLQIRLLQSFVTHVMEIYVESLSSVNEGSGFAWVERFQEKWQPERTVPFREKVVSKFERIEYLKDRDSTIQQLLNRVTYSLGISWDQVVVAATDPESQVLILSESGELGLSPSEYPLSRRGTLYLLVAKSMVDYLENAEELDELKGSYLHADVVRSYIGDEALGGIGTEPFALIDSVLVLGFRILQSGQNRLYTSGDVKFHQYLQRLSLLSANTPSSSLRYQAHLLTTAALQANPSEQARYNFIRDTLEHCPYENLKVSAVGWLKDEIVAATTNKTPEKASVEQSGLTDKEKPLLDSTHSGAVFASPETLKSLAPHIFPIVSLELDSEGFQAQLPFYLAGLNFMYLLYSSPVLRNRFQMSDFTASCSIERNFISPLEVMSHVLSDKLLARDHSEEENATEISDAQLLEDTLARVRTAMKSVGSGITPR